jgi:hypothetical protein
MPTETVHLLTKVGGGPTTDGKSIVMEWTLENGDILKFLIPLVDLPAVVAYMFNEATRAYERCSEEELTAIAKPHQIIPMQLTSIALGPGKDATHNTLHLRLGHLEQSSEVPTATLVAVAKKIIRMHELAQRGSRPALKRRRS